MNKKLLLGCVIVLGILTSACHTDRGSNNQAESNQEDTRTETVLQSEKMPGVKDQSTSSTDHTSTEMAGTTETKETGTTAFNFPIKALKNLGAKAGLISNRYFKAGDIRTAISFSLTQDWKKSDGLTCNFLTQDNQYENYWIGTASAVLNTKSGKMTYSIIAEFSETDQENGTYTLWQTSADTVMKTVYEGDIYILKGAVTGAYTSLSEASKNQKEIYVGEPTEEDGEDTSAEHSVFGNELYYNGKGYFTAVYYLGD